MGNFNEQPWGISASGVTGSGLRDAFQLVFTLVYLGVAALIIAAIGFLLQTTSRTPRPRVLDPFSTTDNGVRWPWRSCGGLRQWLARGCSLGGWLVVAAVVLHGPTLLNLMLEILGVNDARAAAEAAQDIRLDPS